jgi:hypothetical protein
MRWNTFRSVGIFSLMIVFWLAPMAAEAMPADLPQALLRAHTVYIENETGFTDLAYVAVWELNKWGRYELAESREKADLIMRLDSSAHVRQLPDGQVPSFGENASTESAVPMGYTRIALMDPKTNQVLWSGMHKTEAGKVKSGHLLDELRDAFRDYDRGKR